MESRRLRDVAEALHIARKAVPDEEVLGVSTDSRTISSGELFFAVPGENYDGHAYVAEAMRRGAVAAVVERGRPDIPSADERAGETGAVVEGDRLLEVGDTVEALIDLAGWYRDDFSPVVVGITGSNGKTTTKDMVASVLTTRHRTLRTEGNYNNHIGVPHTLFRLESDTEAAVVEIGMNHPGEITTLAGAARPSVGVITNVAASHLESMKDLETIARAKGELLEALPENGTAVLNADDERVMSQAARGPETTVTFGLGPDADVRGSDVRAEGGTVRFTVGGTAFTLPVPGRHNVMNALAAVAVGDLLGVPRDDAAEALSSFEPTANRMQVLTAGEWTILNDTYNANPGSVAVAVETAVTLAAGRPVVAVLGDMLELGDAARDAHRDVGALAARAAVDRLFLTGEHAGDVRDGAVEFGMDPDRIAIEVSRAALPGAIAEALIGSAVILVKGSRGMRMEEVVESLVREAPASGTGR
ncbi:MAG: UDP-N-acetylmuramoyl-tripeptide--D-alanyl-D-alanine ligase [Candidatus Eisenbacteria bacterium]|nr:UDP-N-acetylmuramoyl-tripeptide--D-alanyl-D-alanine ligase [Candidatus Eisenbacteria bacterium]